MQRVLVVDDDELIQALVVRALQRVGYDVLCVANADAARAELERFEPELIVLDIMLPGMSGIDFCHELRKTHDVPVIFLSGLDTDVDRIVGLEIGADDYLTKPFHPGELLARVRAVLRRATPPEVPKPTHGSDATLQHGALHVDLERHVVFIDGEEIELTKTEFMLLSTLMRRPTKVYSRDDLMSGAYGPATYVAERTINSHMRRLRSKLDHGGFDPIETVRGVGYRIAKLD